MRGGVTSEIQLIACDFGGVICRFDYRIFCERLAPRVGRTAEEIYAQVFGDSLQQQFERGRLSALRYHRRVMDRLGGSVPYDEFFRLYGDIFSEIPATCALLERLHPRYPLYLLSDTNEIHFGYVLQTVGVLRHFREFVVSYQLGLLKPDPGMYREVLRRSGLPAAACVFIDDRAGNVEGAVQAGMQGIRFESAAQCTAALAALGVAAP
jgi:FMN phosphatase YigB (HAD superfamily)